MKREISGISVQTNSENNKYIVGDYYMPMLGTIRNAKIHNIPFEEDNTMYYLKDRRKEDRIIYIQLNILV